MTKQELLESFEIIYDSRKDINWKLDQIIVYLDLNKKTNNDMLRNYDIAVTFFTNKDPELVSLILKEMNIEHSQKMAENHVDDNEDAYEVSSVMYQFMQQQRQIENDGISIQVFHYDVWKNAFSKKAFKRISVFIAAFEEIEIRDKKGIFVA